MKEKYRIRRSRLYRQIVLKKNTGLDTARREKWLSIFMSITLGNIHSTKKTIWYLPRKLLPGICKCFLLTLFPRSSIPTPLPPPRTSPPHVFCTLPLLDVFFLSLCASAKHFPYSQINGETRISKSRLSSDYTAVFTTAAGYWLANFGINISTKDDRGGGARGRFEGLIMLNN